MSKIDYNRLFIESLKKHKNNPKWDKGNFIGIKTVSNTKVGSVGQDFIESLCDTLSIKCIFPLKKNGERATQSPWDRELYTMLPSA